MKKKVNDEDNYYIGEEDFSEYLKKYNFSLQPTETDSYRKKDVEFFAHLYTDNFAYPEGDVVKFFIDFMLKELRPKPRTKGAIQQGDTLQQLQSRQTIN